MKLYLYAVSLLIIRFFSMNIQDFITPFCVAPNDVCNARNNLEEFPRDWIKKSTHKLSLTNWFLGGTNEKYLISHNNYDYHVLFIPRPNSNKLVVSLCGGGRKNKAYPLFTRWKYYNYLNANFLCIEDPMYNLYPQISDALWYYGDKEHWLINDVADIVRNACSQLKISYSNLVFLGSSGGGTASIYLANLFEDSVAIALNPQYFLHSWNPDITDFFKKRLKINLFEQDNIFPRNYPKLLSSKSRFFLCENYLSEKDKLQFIPFFKQNSIPIKYGINQYNNVVTWIHATNGRKIHSSNPEKLEILLINYLNEELKSGGTIAQISSISCYLNEYLNIKYIGEFYKEKSKILNKFVLDSIQQRILAYFEFSDPVYTKAGDGIFLYFRDFSDIYYKIVITDDGVSLYLIFSKDIGNSCLEPFKDVLGNLKSNSKSYYFKNKLSSLAYDDILLFFRNTFYKVLYMKSTICISSGL